MVTKTEITNKFNEIFESNKLYAQLSEIEKLYALLALTSNAGGSALDTVMLRDKTTSTNKLSIDANGLIGINNLNVLGTKLDNILSELDTKASLIDTQPVSLSSIPLAAGAATSSNQISGNSSLSSIDIKLTTVNTRTLTSTDIVSSVQSGTWNLANITGTISLPTGAATSAKQPSLGTAGSASTDVITVQGITNGTALSINQIANTATANITFTASTTSSTFTITNRLALIVIPVIASAPTLTLQVTLDGGTTWVNSSVFVIASASIAQTLEADSLSKLSGAFGLSSAFRFNSTASITATCNLRSITQ